jgi:formylglycine-generating enzyme required for sulfatase activity
MRWSHKSILCLQVCALAVVAERTHAQDAGTLGYQGRVSANGGAFTGTGLFKFALVNADGSAIYWSNAASTNSDGQANAAVSLPVVRGLFVTILGDTNTPNMATLPVSVFTNKVGTLASDGLYLRVWFDDGTSGLQKLTPDQQLSGVGFSLAANYAKIAGSLVGPISRDLLPAGVLTNGAFNVTLSGSFSGDGAGLTNIPTGSLNGTFPTSQLIGSIPATSITGTLSSSQLAAAAVTSTQLASNAVRSGNITNGAVGSSQIAAGAVGNNHLAGNLTLGGITTGKFAGDGSGLTNLSASQLIGGIPATSITGTLTSSQLAAGAVTSTQLGANAVQSGNIASGAVGSAQIAAAAVGNTHLAGNLTLGGLTTGSFVGDGAGLTNIPTASLTGTIPAGSVTGLSASAIAVAPPAGMVLIPAGTFTMGNPAGIGDNDLPDAVPVNAFVSGFYIDTTPVTWSLWSNVYAYATNHGYTFLHAGSAYNSAQDQPVASVDWYDCVKWCNARSEQAGLVPVYYSDAGLTSVYRSGEGTVYTEWFARGYRLPTEAEWEKAARGGRSNQRFPWGLTISTNQANYKADAGGPAYDIGPRGLIGHTTPVGSYPPNGYGLYDMAGNLFEWCWDWQGTPYSGGADPRGPSTGSLRIYRGGDWQNFAFYSRCAARSQNLPTYTSGSTGFRTVIPSAQ